MLAKAQDYFNMKFLVFYFFFYIWGFNLQFEFNLQLLENFVYCPFGQLSITRYKNVYSIHLQLTPSGSISLIKSMHLIKNPVKTCDTVYSLIQSLTSQIRHRMEDPKSSGKYFVFLGSENKNQYPIAVNILKQDAPIIKKL